MSLEREVSDSDFLESVATIDSLPSIVTRDFSYFVVQDNSRLYLKIGFSVGVAIGALVSFVAIGSFSSDLD